MPTRAKPQTILIVDDAAENCALAQATLEDEGYHVLIARTGLDALQTFERTRPDCVLLDVRMPGMDGFEVCEKLRALPAAQQVPVIFLTALRDVDTFDRALRAGADDFLIKPIRPAELAARIQATLKLARMSAELRSQCEVIRQQRDSLMREQLQKDRMAAFIVHDLKNPAGAIDLHAQLILRDAALSERSRESAQRVREEVRHLMRLVMNLLDLSRCEQGELTFESNQVELEPVVREVVSTFEVRARNAEVTLRYDLAAPTAYANAELLQRVLSNLVDNALRHAPEDSAVFISSVALPGAVELRVRDFGSGVPAELRDKVFQPFVQLEHAERAVTRAGRGLGLTFCRVAAQAHGGSIWIEDAAPGATFCVRLPHEP